MENGVAAQIRTIETEYHEPISNWIELARSVAMPEAPLTRAGPDRTPMIASGAMR